ncbi:MAG: methylmalonyl-CoA mutase family protein, partial [bacterium]|nr:methylmalonyl-CoA mutase family protein [bacterium]
MTATEVYQPTHPVRIVTAASLFDGHDASINIMRRLLQATGAEVIHLGHNRSVEEIAVAAVQEDAQGIALTSYQGGHIEFFKYLRERLTRLGADQVRIYGGGGGTIVPREIEELHAAGINRIFSPEDGRRLGLQGMINEVVQGCDFDLTPLAAEGDGAFQSLARRITRVEAGRDGADGSGKAQVRTTPVVGITGTGGAGKSSLTDELVRRFLGDFDDKRVAVLSIDPTRRRSGGALLGDRIRFNSIRNPRFYMRSLATRGARGELSESIADILTVARGDFDLVFVETAGIGQGDSAISEVCDLALYVMTSEYGAPSQLEKIDMLDYADLIAINKFTRRGSEDALRDVRKQYQRNHQLFDRDLGTLPIFGTNAAHFNDRGLNALYGHLVAALNQRIELGWSTSYPADERRTPDGVRPIIPPGRERYLSDVSASCRDYRRWVDEQCEAGVELEALGISLGLLDGNGDRPSWGPLPIPDDDGPRRALAAEHNRLLDRLDPRCREILEGWDDWQARYEGERFTYQVRGRDIAVDNYRETLAGSQIPKVARPRFRGAG